VVVAVVWARFSARPSRESVSARLVARHVAGPADASPALFVTATSALSARAFKDVDRRELEQLMASVGGPYERVRWSFHPIGEVVVERNRLGIRLLVLMRYAERNIDPLSVDEWNASASSDAPFDRVAHLEWGRLRRSSVAGGPRRRLTERFEASLDATATLARAGTGLQLHGLFDTPSAFTSRVAGRIMRLCFSDVAGDDVKERIDDVDAIGRRLLLLENALASGYEAHDVVYALAGDVRPIDPASLEAWGLSPGM
jgi:hypothetical protein